jgi:hypothetical protein
VERLERPTESLSRVLGAFLLVVLVALSYRLWFGADLVFPIDNDAAYYRTMGQRLFSDFGRENLIWHYLTDATEPSRPSFDYWMPLPALLSGLSNALFGGGPGAETFPGIVASAVLSGLCFFLAVRLGVSLWASVGAGLLSIFLWSTTYASLDGDSPIFYACFLNLVFLAMTFLPQRPLLAALGCGTALAMAHLSRSDAILLIPTLIVWWGYEYRVRGLRMPGKTLWVGLGAYLACMAPFFLRNLVVLGTLLPPGSSRAVWVTSYYEIYAVSALPAPGEYFDQGLRWLLETWQDGLSNNLGMLAGVFPVLLIPFVALGLPGLSRRTVGRTMLLWAVVLLLFHGTALAVVGGFKRSYVALIPVVMVGAWMGWQVLFQRAVERGLWGRAAAILATLALLSPGVWFALQRAPEYRQSYATQTAYDLARHQALSTWFQANGPEAIIASPKPFFPWYATGLDCVMVPHQAGADFDVVVSRFGVTHLVVDLLRLSERPDLRDFQALVAAGKPVAGFVPVARIADLAIYRLP